MRPVHHDLATIPKGVDPLSLKCWAEFRRRRIPMAQIARRTGYGIDTIRRFLAGEKVRRRELVAADVWEVVGRD